MKILPSLLIGIISSSTETKKTLFLKIICNNFSGWGFDLVELDGHNFNDIDAELQKTKAKTKIIIANTVKGKGIQDI